VIVDESAEPILALPYIDINVEDELPRAYSLLENILPKFHNIAWPDESETIGFIQTSEHDMSLVSDYLVKKVKLCFTHTLHEPTLMQTLESLDNECGKTDAPNYWLWVSIHTGCARRMLETRKFELTCNARSEGRIAADAAVVVLLKNESHSGTVRSSVEPYADSPLENSMTALHELLMDVPDVDQKTFVHTFDGTPESAVEIYKFKQAISSDKTQAQSADWQMEPFYEVSMNNVLGNVGVCSLPLQLIFQQYWPKQQPSDVVMVTTEDKHRIVWNLTAESA
jgi:hypothetical protein